MLLLISHSSICWEKPALSTPFTFCFPYLPPTFTALPSSSILAPTLHFQILHHQFQNSYIHCYTHSGISYHLAQEILEMPLTINLGEVTFLTKKKVVHFNVTHRPLDYKIKKVLCTCRLYKTLKNLYYSLTRNSQV